MNAGHDLDLKNIPAYAKAVKGLQEVSIGHALIADALYMGLTRTVKAYLKALGSKPLNRKENAASDRLQGAGVFLDRGANFLRERFDRNPVLALDHHARKHLGP